jgi:hypothetical protein
MTDICIDFGCSATYTMNPWEPWLYVAVACVFFAVVTGWATIRGLTT